jgi:hypothetical protein
MSMRRHASLDRRVELAGRPRRPHGLTRRAHVPRAGGGSDFGGEAARVAVGTESAYIRVAFDGAAADAVLVLDSASTAHVDVSVRAPQAAGECDDHGLRRRVCTSEVKGSPVVCRSRTKSRVPMLRRRSWPLPRRSCSSRGPALRTGASDGGALAALRGNVGLVHVHRNLEHAAHVALVHARDRTRRCQ